MNLLLLLVLAASAAASEGRVRHANVYPGIHLDVYSAPDGAEYDWVVEPGAHPDQIAMRFPGATGIHIAAGGDLRMQTAGGAVRHSAPFTYQIRDGRRVEIASRFVERAPGVIGFETGAFDPALALVIDPVIQLSKTAGNFGQEFSGDFARDAAGNYYILKDDLNGGPATLRKLSASGDSIFSRTLPVEFRDQLELALDTAGNIYVASMMSACPAATTRVIGDIANGPKMAVWKLRPDALTQSYLLCLQPGGVTLNVFGLAVDATGQAFVAGRTDSANFPATGTFGNIVAGQQHLYVFKVNAAGDSLPISVMAGNGTSALAVTLDTQGNIVVGGHTGPDLPLVNALQPQYGGGNIDGFVMKIRNDGLQILHSTFLGGADSDTVSDVAVDGAGNIIAVGDSLSANFPTAGPFARAAAGNRDGFVAKLNATGTSLRFSTMLGGSLGDFVYRVALRPSGEIYVAGETDSPNFPVVRPLQPFRESDAFVATLDGNGLIVFSTYLGGTGLERLPHIVLNADGFAVSGTTHSANFPRVPFFSFSVLAGAADAFLTVYKEEADISAGTLSRFAAVRNHGPDAAMSVQLTINIASGAVDNQDGRCTVASTVTTCALGTVQAGALVIPSVALRSSPVSMTAVSSIFDPNLLNNVD